MLAVLSLPSKAVFRTSSTVDTRTNFISSYIQIQTDTGRNLCVLVYHSQTTLTSRVMWQQLYMINCFTTQEYTTQTLHTSQAHHNTPHKHVTQTPHMHQHEPTLAGLWSSRRSFSFLLGRSTCLMPALWAANTFSLMPPT